MITDEKILFDDAFLKEIQDKFYYVHEDYLGRKRQFFENSGGSLRLKAAVEEKARLARPFRAILQALSFDRGLDAEFAEAFAETRGFLFFLRV